ncbi:MAG: deoxyguanosinetriphosphate triphosphohydrolase [Gammaproteobacteria bacterium]|nr:deoxyguanosinetriphosphate triphosphohydrolase [Gammaproteobacteria bacterium]
MPNSRGRQVRGQLPRIRGQLTQLPAGVESTVPQPAYAASESTSRGRRYPEPVHPYRGAFQRDRDRILHSSAFRRLVYKTQVFINHEGDLYRTRLTHSLEVAQVARTVAAQLGLHETLTEAICLAHDLGHTPFGHSGQDALDRCMKPWGGFEHNLQSLRVVDELEERYADFPGLNLTYETREGILKHCSRRNARALGELGERFLKRRQPGLEAQLANVADEIAWSHHDLDDGLRAGLITLDELVEVGLFKRHHRSLRGRRSPMSRRVLVHATVRAMMDQVITDLIEATRGRLARLRPVSIEAVRAHGRPLVALSPAMVAGHRELKVFLNRHLYRHERVLARNRRAQALLAGLFECYMNDVRAMPREHAERALAWEREQGARGRARAVADYIAGMTDRYAAAAYRRLVDPGLEW